MTQALEVIYIISLLAIIFVGCAVANRLNRSTRPLVRYALLSPLFAAVLALISIIDGPHATSVSSVLASIPCLALYIILLKELQGVVVIKYSNGHLRSRGADRRSSSSGSGSIRSTY